MAALAPSLGSTSRSWGRYDPPVAIRWRAIVVAFPSGGSAIVADHAAAGRPVHRMDAMNPMITSTQMIRLSLQTGMMLMEAQMVIGMRLLGMAGLWRVQPSENARMSAEKVSAATEVAMATSHAIMARKSPTVIAEAALKPISRRTRSNVKRLARRGPGKP